MKDWRMYLGDGAYVKEGEFGITLTTEDGIGVTNTVVLGEEEWSRLLQWVAARYHHRKEERAEAAAAADEWADASIAHVRICERERDDA